MCGICGFVSNKRIDISVLSKMNDTMINRGPNDFGTEILHFSNDCVIGLAHRRLTILDLSEKGHQPFFSKDKNVVLVFNGEIYNYRELKRELSQYSFESSCDTEVIIAAYERWGREFISHIEGMYAFALLDRKNNALILCRDRIGKKPLYYYKSNRDFVFGSTLKPIMEYPFFEKEIKMDVIPTYLFNQYISGTDSIFKNVHKVKPGEMIVYDGSRISSYIYWDLLESYKKNKERTFISFAEAKAELKKELICSVGKRMVADVPVGAFLSGGYDSSLVTAIAQSLSEQPLKTYSIGFDDPLYDEAPYAKEIAKYLGTDHVNHYVTEKEMLDLVDSIPECYDEPFADSSQIPSMLVASIASKDVTVVLTGDGGDELFCGYSMYDKLTTSQRLEPAAEILRQIIKEDQAWYPSLPFSVRAILENRDNRFRTQLGRAFYMSAIYGITGEPREVRYDEGLIAVDNWQIRRMLLDSVTYLPDNNLCKVDRATMYHSLEARNPLLDVHTVETAFRIPHRFKYHRRNKKYILKQLTYDYIPEKLLDRPKKGFSVPIDKWLHGPLRVDLEEMTSVEYLRNQGVFMPEYTNSFVQKYLASGDCGPFSGQNASHIVWPLYMFQKWYQRYME